MTQAGQTLRIAAIILATFLGVQRVTAEELTSALAESSVLDRLAQIEGQLAAMQQSLASPSDATVGEDYFVEPSVSSSGRFFGAEATILVPQVGAMAASGVILGNPLGTVEITPDFKTFVGGRFWLGSRNAEGLGGRIRFWDYDARATGTLGPIDVDSRVSLSTLDGELTQLVDLGVCEVDLSAGLRWGRISRKTLLDNVRLSQAFSGLGPTIAIGARRPFWGSNVALVGNARGSFLFGDNDHTGFIDANNNFTLTDRYASVLAYETQAGLEWTRPTASGSQFYVRCMAEAQIWQVPPSIVGLLAQTSGLVGLTCSFGVNW